MAKLTSKSLNKLLKKNTSLHDATVLATCGRQLIKRGVKRIKETAKAVNHEPSYLAKCILKNIKTVNTFDRTEILVAYLKKIVIPGLEGKLPTPDEARKELLKKLYNERKIYLGPIGSYKRGSNIAIVGTDAARTAVLDLVYRSASLHFSDLKVPQKVIRVSTGINLSGIHAADVFVFDYLPAQFSIFKDVFKSATFVAGYSYVEFPPPGSEVIYVEQLSSNELVLLINDTRFVIPVPGIL
jgi:hypothetical protein